MVRRPRRRVFWLLPLLLLAGCAFVSPRFSPSVAASFAHDRMRRMETGALVVYYPEHARAAVLHTVSRLQQCAERLRSNLEPDAHRPKLVILITSSEFNNAYVSAQVLGNPTEMVLPVQMGAEVFNFFDFGVTNIGDVACHESVHYVQLEHTQGFWRYVNLVFGDVASPNLGTETWFLEGLATYFEGHLGRAHGRPHSPLWNGMYESGIASQGELQPGQLSPAQRQLYPFGGNYLAGSHFIGWLAQTYGEEKLWELVDRQGESILFPFGVTLRVRSVYGKTLGGLLDDYNAQLRREYGTRVRPSGQQVLDDDQGYFARLASGPGGELVSLSVGLDQESKMTLWEPDGRVRFRVKLTPILPERPYIFSSPSDLSGLSFTADGRSIFFFSEELAADGASTYEVRQFDARDGHFVKSWRGLRGVGGSALPDGSAYVYVAIEKGHAELARLDLKTSRTTLLTHLGGYDPLGAPSVSPDGQRIVFSRFGSRGFDLYLREADGSVRPLTSDGRFNYSARWIDAHRVLFLRESGGHSQAHLLDVDSGALSQITHAPWAVLDPVPAADGRIAFLNREGWQWTLDTAPVLPVSAQSTAEGSRQDEGPVAAAAPPVQVENDQRYSLLDELFLPRLRVPFAAPTFDPRGQVQPYVAGSLMGFDRLGLNSWAINVLYDGYVGEPSVSVGYANAQLAPWYLSVSLDRAVGRRALYAEGADRTKENLVGSSFTRDLSASLSASRPFWSTNVAFSARALDRHDTEDGDSRLLGPSASVSWFAGSGTPYAGTRRGLSTDFSASVFPRALGSSMNVADLRAAFTGWIPLPGPKRQTFSLGVRGRAVPSATGGMLQVGGTSSGLFLRPAPVPSAEGPDVELPGIAFVEPLRGFDDVSFQANAVGIVSARYRYPFIVDRGSTATLWLFPSFFLRQVELEGFFEGARTDEALMPFHGAVGAMVRVRTLWGSVLPASLFYQYAYRLDPGLGSQHVIGLTLD